MIYMAIGVCNYLYKNESKWEQLVLSSFCGVSLMKRMENVNEYLKMSGRFLNDPSEILGFIFVSCWFYTMATGKETLYRSCKDRGKPVSTLKRQYGW